MPYFTHHTHQLFYREQGSGPLLLILPGNTASSACHAGELDYFGRQYRAVSLDFWGTGQSDRMERWPENWWEICAHDAVALANHLGEQTFIALGTSGGANVALLLAILYPEQARAVIADSTVPFFTVPAIENAISVRNLRLPAQIEFWQLAHGDDWSQVITADSEMLLRFVEAGGDHFKGRLDEIGCPVLFTASLRDQSLPEIAAQTCRMAEHVANSQVFLVNGGDHPLVWTRPAEFRRAADMFLQGLASI